MCYAQETQRTALRHITGLRRETIGEAIVLDATTQRNLELTQSLSGHSEHTLFALIDKTATAMGGRLLRRWLVRPLRDTQAVSARHDAVAALCTATIASAVHPILKQIGDLERIVARIALESARPRDLAQLRTGLSVLPTLTTTLNACDNPLLRELTGRCLSFEAIVERLTRALVEAPPALLRDGGVIAPAYDEELDALRSLGDESSTALLALEAREKERTGLGNLKVGYNRVHGYYLEISRAQADKIPAEYIRRQTLKGVERYITPELKAFEDKVMGAAERARAREKHLYEALIHWLCTHLEALRQCTQAVATIDVLVNFAECAESLKLHRPHFSSDTGLTITAGRHLVVEKRQETPFTPNDLALNSERRMLIITGPNMGGKSTYMRQTALIVILAHIGSFVPADKAIIGPIERIFTRIGAADDLASGRSTFMVEMTETANILHNANAQSLVLLDEIGRGTSTYDGLALAWAAAQYLTEKLKALTLFATHYFELTAFAHQHPEAANVHLRAIERAQHIVFLHQVEPGPANRSYGLQVAALAGVPPAVLENARTNLHMLESGDSLGERPTQITRQPTQTQATPEQKTDPVHELLHSLNVNDISPRQALDTLYQLRALLDDN